MARRDVSFVAWHGRKDVGMLSGRSGRTKENISRLIVNFRWKHVSRESSFLDMRRSTTKSVEDIGISQADFKSRVRKLVM